MLENNLFAYCFNNPVNMTDEDGQWPSWATKVAIGVGVIALCAVITVATGGAGAGVAGFIAAGALKGAIIGAASGAVIGAGTGAVGHRISTGSWKGAGTAALNGGANGFMTGAISGAITGAASNSLKVAQAAKSWGSAGGRSSFQNMSSHYGKHVVKEGHSYLGKNVVGYTNNAKNFFTANQSVMKLTSSGNYAIRAAFAGQKVGGFFSATGKVLSFF
jgi:hypothetical protein